MENDIKKTETAFFGALGNGVKAAEHLQTLTLAVVSSRDTTILTRQMQRAESEKNDTGASAAIRKVIAAVFVGAKIKKDKKTGGYSVSIKGVQADADALKRLEQAVEKNLSIRHAAFGKLLKGETDKPEFDVKAWAERTAKARPDQLEAMIAALQAQRNGVSVDF